MLNRLTERFRASKLFPLFEKYRELIAYVFFGGCTTLVNTAAYWLCYDVLRIANIPSTLIAWVLAVLFAYVTNKLWVFESRSFEKKLLLKEICSFFGARAATGLLDLGIMYIGVDVLEQNGLPVKIISNVIVIVLNYVLSKLVIFKKAEKQN